MDTTLKMKEFISRKFVVKKQKFLAVMLVFLLILGLSACAKPTARIPDVTTLSQEDGSAMAQTTSPAPAPEGVPGRVVPTEDTTEAVTEAPAETFEEVVLLDNEYVTVLQVSAFSEQGADIQFVNKSDGELNISFSGGTYINDVKQYAYRDYNYASNQIVKSGETLTLTKQVTSKQKKLSEIYKLDISLRIIYDNREVGVYHKQEEVVNDIFNIYTADSPVSDKYVPTGEEIYALDTDKYGVWVTDCGSEGYYTATIYLENKTEEYLYFRFEDYNNSITSDQQTEPLYTYILSYDNAIAVAPGKGYYKFFEIDTYNVDNYAKDINEVVTVSMPVSVYEGDVEVATDVRLEELTVMDEFAISITRDQFRQ